MKFLIWIDAFVSQVLPPMWREEWQENFLKGLVTPFKTIYNDFYSYSVEVKQDINISTQVIVLEALLNRKAGFKIPLIYLVDGQKTGEFIIYSPQNFDSKDVINSVMKSLLRGGTRYEIIEYKN